MLLPLPSSREDRDTPARQVGKEKFGEQGSSEKDGVGHYRVASDNDPKDGVAQTIFCLFWVPDVGMRAFFRRHDHWLDQVEN